MRFTQEELASRAGLTKQYISNLERDTISHTTGEPVQPSHETLRKLASALRVPLPEILTALYPEARTDDPEYAGFSDNRSDLTPEQQRLIADLEEQFRRANVGP